MKKGIHPDYRPVAFRDITTGTTFVTRSTVASNKTIEIDGATYPLIDADVTSASHPFWTGKQSVLDTEGRVEAFNRRYGRARPEGGR